MDCQILALSLLSWFEWWLSGIFDPQWKINRNLQVLSVFQKKKRENQEKLKKNGKNGLKKSVKLRKKSVQIGNYRSNPIA